jgi:hypothetical protein
LSLQLIDEILLLDSLDFNLFLDKIGNVLADEFVLKDGWNLLVFLFIERRSLIESESLVVVDMIEPSP